MSSVFLVTGFCDFVAINRRRVPVALVHLNFDIRCWEEDPGFGFLAFIMVPSHVASIVAGGFQCCSILCCI